MIVSHDTLGTVAQGIGNDIQLKDFAGKAVVIVGIGAFAVENTRRALMGGAEKITVIARTLRPWLPEYATYTLRRELQSEDAFTRENIVQMWRKTHKIVSTVAEHCSVTDFVLNSHTLRFVDGEPSFAFAHGLPSLSSNVLYLAVHYGLVNVINDEVLELQGAGVRTKSGLSVDCDILLTCCGFQTSSIMKEHSVMHSAFVDGAAHVTTNLRADRVNGIKWLGANERHSDFLDSYFEDAAQYERCYSRLLESPAAFAELVAQQSATSTMSSVDYFTTLDLSEKLRDSSDMEIQRILLENRLFRAHAYTSLLPLKVFLQHDEAAWMRLSREFAKRAEKPTLQYPFSKI